MAEGTETQERSDGPFTPTFLRPPVTPTDYSIFKTYGDNLDDNGKVALAKALEEAGSKDLALAVRWCRKWDRWPARMGDGNWQWVRGGNSLYTDYLTNCIPESHWRWFHTGTYYTYSSSLTNAIRTLANALAIMREEATA